MKTYIFLLLTFLFAFNAKSQVTNRIINTKVITEINEPLIAAIERHIVVSKAKRIKNKNDFFILIYIFPDIQKWSIPKDVFDSIYSNNDFQTIFPMDSVTPEYNIIIALVNKKHYTDGWSLGDCKNSYYYKYNEYEVLISSGLNITFKNEGKTKQIVVPLYNERYSKRNKYYKIWTRYSMWNRYIAEVRFKDLIWPNWTGNRDEFK